MAAIDPSAAPEHTGTANGDVPPRATLKIVYDPQGPGDEDEDSEASDDEDEVLKALLQAQGSDDEGEDDEDEDESSSDEEERNGGPSDPSKTKKARKEAALKELMSALADQNDSDHEMDIDGETGVNDSMTKSKAEKGKAKAVPGDSDEDEDGESDDSLDGMEEIVLCTLDPTKVWFNCNVPRKELIQLDRNTNRLLMSRFLRIREHISRYQARMQSTCLEITSCLPRGGLAIIMARMTKSIMTCRQMKTNSRAMMKVTSLTL